MSEPILIDPNGIYTDGILVLRLGLTHAALADARKTRRLRFTRKGRRVFYRGQWLLDWMDVDANQRQKGGGHE